MKMISNHLCMYKDQKYFRVFVDNSLIFFLNLFALPQVALYCERIRLRFLSLANEFHILIYRSPVSLYNPDNF